jgi:hypothetical protein
MSVSTLVIGVVRVVRHLLSSQLEDIFYIRSDLFRTLFDETFES